MKKRILSIVLALTLLVGIIPMTMLSVSAKAVDNDLAKTAFSPDNFKAQIKKVIIGKPITGTDGKKYLPVDVHFFAAENLSDAQVVYFLEGYMKAQLKDGKLAESIRGLGMTLMGPMKPDVALGSNMWNWDWTPYETGGGQGVIKYNVPLLDAGDTQTVEKSQATGMTEVNGVKVGDKITFQNETVVNTNGFPEQMVQELFPNGPSVFSDPVTITVEDASKYPKTITPGEPENPPAECTHENQKTMAEVLNVKGNVTIDGKTTGVALLKDTEECTDCHQKKTTKVYRLRFSSRKQMLKYLYGKYAKLSNGKKVHFKGKYQKVEKVYWNKKHIKVSKTYNKKKGSVILEFTDDFLASVDDGTHELMVCNGDEFTAMTVTVQNHEMVEIGAYDMDAEVSITADEYDAVMQECEDNGIEVVDCDLDEFYASGFMTNADDVEVTMSLSADSVVCTGKAITPPSVTLKSETGTEYAEDTDYTLSYYQTVEGEDGEPEEVEISREAITEAGAYAVVALPTRSGVLFGEARAQFTVSAVIKLGDANGDNAVNILDATAIQRHLADIPNDYFSEDAADTDRNGSVAIVDATYIQRWLADIDTPAGIGEPIEEDPIDVLDSGSLVGTWVYEEDANFVYTFNANGTGTYTIHGEVLNLTYQDNGTSVDYEMGGVPGSFEYTISGNTLIIKDSAGDDVKYTRQ